MGGFLTFILSVVLGFWLLGLIGRIVLRVWIKRLQKRYEQNPNGANFRTYTWGNGAQGWGQRPQQDGQTRSEGEVRVENKEQPKRVVNKDIGEYVEFEEIKEPTENK